MGGIDLAPIIEHFDRHPLYGKKAYSYQIWRELILMKQSPSRESNSYHTTLRELVETLSQCNTKNEKGRS